MGHLSHLSKINTVPIFSYFPIYNLGCNITLPLPEPCKHRAINRVKECHSNLFIFQ